MKEAKRVELQEEFYRLQEITGLVHIRSCCTTCNKVSVLHAATGLIVSSEVKWSPLENGVEALRELVKSMCN